MEKLELCKECNLFSDCKKHCDDALQYKKMEGNRKKQNPKYSQEKIIDRTIDFANNSSHDPSVTPISIINHRKQFNQNKNKNKK